MTADASGFWTEAMPGLGVAISCNLFPAVEAGSFWENSTWLVGAWGAIVETAKVDGMGLIAGLRRVKTSCGFVAVSGLASFAAGS